MSPTSLEEALRYFQKAAKDLDKATLKLDESLRAVNDLLVQAAGDEVLVEWNRAGSLLWAERNGPDAGVLVGAYGIARFKYGDESDPKEQLALALRYDSLSPALEELEGAEYETQVPTWTWVPVVSLPGFAAPRPAPRRLRKWVGQHLDEIVREIAEKVKTEAEYTAEAAKVPADLHGKLTGTRVSPNTVEGATAASNEAPANQHLNAIANSAVTDKTAACDTLYGVANSYVRGPRGSKPGATLKAVVGQVDRARRNGVSEEEIRRVLKKAISDPPNADPGRVEELEQKFLQ